jgi:hypothetical protein
MTPSTEDVARTTTIGIFAELTELCAPANDDCLAAWEMARQKAAELYHAMDTVCVQIQTRHGNRPSEVPMTTRIFLDRLPGFREAEAIENDLASPFVQRRPA